MNVHHYKSPVGILEIKSDGKAVTDVNLLKNESVAKIASTNPVIMEACKQFDEYFAGERQTFDLPLSPKGGTPFQQMVWKQLQEIPYGETISYSQLAQAVNNPKACRAVGSANGKNPISIIIPCHRVIASDGTLGGYAGGLNMKRQLLSLEKSPVLTVKEPAVAYGKKRYSYADYLTWTDDKMLEIINGIVYLFSAPFRNHAHSTANFFGNAWSFINRRKGKCKIYTAPFDVRLPIDGETADNKIYNVVQPDICVICDLSKLDERGCIGAPDLVVEVISPSTSKRDLDQKFSLYEKAGVNEYWVVYPNDGAVIVFLHQPDGKYDEGTTYELINGAKKVPVKTLEGLEIDLDELFAD